MKEQKVRYWSKDVDAGGGSKVKGELIWTLL